LLRHAGARRRGRHLLLLLLLLQLLQRKLLRQTAGVDTMLLWLLLLVMRQERHASLRAIGLLLLLHGDVACARGPFQLLLLLVRVGVLVVRLQRVSIRARVLRRV